MSNPQWNKRIGEKMDLKNSVTCQRCMMEMRETILQDIPTCRATTYYCEKCAIMVSMYAIQESVLDEMSYLSSPEIAEIHPLEDK